MPPDAIVIPCDVLLRDDDSEQREAGMLLGEAVWCLLRAGVGANVVLRCDAGRNRSALVAAWALIFQDVDPEEAIATIRNARAGALGGTGGALTNESFVRYLKGAA